MIARSRPIAGAGARGGRGDDRVLDPTNPVAIARTMIEREFTAFGHQTLRHYRGRFYLWKKSHYRSVADQAIHALIYAFLEVAKRPVPRDGIADFKPARKSVGDVFDALKAISYLDDDLVPPVWLSHFNRHPASEFVATQSGLLHFPTRNLLRHTPAFFGLNATSYPYDPQAAVPKAWLAFLKEIWPGDVESIDTLQEFFGYSLTNDTSRQKIFLLIGTRRTGKSTIARLLTALVGEGNVANPTLSGICTNFGMAPLVGKQLAIIGDARLGPGVDTSTVAERLLSISGEDSMTVDRKFLNDWTGKLSVRFLMLTNELPRFSDASGALASRFIILKLIRSFYGKEDLTLEKRLMGELTGIFNWALEGLDRLVARGHFVQPSTSAQVVEELEELGSPIAAYIKARCTVDSYVEVTIADLYADWRGWCETNGYKPSNIQRFGRDLHAAVPNLRISQLRESDDRVRMYAGITLRR